ncbi:clathrin light chain-like isoform X2 [Stegodyphus dumicola]|uniref:clathrin light chain-like isoform X2 n=1 Tax=Stegodyphus dumicola TaxID=202533 RepID=UPI0015AEE6C5|nr:clathrin light chain-like isoform X2 [Stegodyphus dumicola]
MSDFEIFDGDINHVSAEEDPAADFLAREQDELAGLEDDTLGLSSGTNAAVSDFNENAFETHNAVNSEHMNGPSEPFPATTPSRSANREEPQKIKMWREEQQKMLEIKDAEEEKKKLELQQTAKKELDDWYARYREQIEKAKLNNRNAEKEWVADRDAESPGQEWERIARLCDFNPKSSRSTKDTSRMRSIILQLKQSPIPPRNS